MSKLLKSFGVKENDAYLEWLDGAEACGEMDSCENRAGILLKLARQELERLGHDVLTPEEGLMVILDPIVHFIQVVPGLAVISYLRGEKDNPGSVVADVYDDSLEALAEILGRIPPANAFPYCLIGKSIRIADDTGHFHVNFIGRLPVVSVGGRHIFLEGALVAGGCDDDGNYCHVPVDAIYQCGWEVAGAGD